MSDDHLHRCKELTSSLKYPNQYNLLLSQRLINDFLDRSLLLAMTSVEDGVVYSVLYTQEMCQVLVISFFVTLTQLVSRGVQLITEDVRNSSSIFNLTPYDRVMNWQRSYKALFLIVQELNEFFGPILLIFIGTHFVSLGVMLFWAALSWFKDGLADPLTTIYTTKITVLLTATMFATRNLNTKVSH